MVYVPKEITVPAVFEPLAGATCVMRSAICATAVVPFLLSVPSPSLLSAARSAAVIAPAGTETVSRPSGIVAVTARLIASVMVNEGCWAVFVRSNGWRLLAGVNGLSLAGGGRCIVVVAR